MCQVLKCLSLNTEAQSQTGAETCVSSHGEIYCEIDFVLFYVYIQVLTMSGDSRSVWIRSVWILLSSLRSFLRLPQTCVCVSSPHIVTRESGHTELWASGSRGSSSASAETDTHWLLTNSRTTGVRAGGGGGGTGSHARSLHKNPAWWTGQVSFRSGHKILGDETRQVQSHQIQSELLNDERHVIRSWK